MSAFREADVVGMRPARGRLPLRVRGSGRAPGACADRVPAPLRLSSLRGARVRVPRRGAEGPGGRRRRGRGGGGVGGAVRLRPLRGVGGPTSPLGASGSCGVVWLSQACTPLMAWSRGPRAASGLRCGTAPEPRAASLGRRRLRNTEAARAVEARLPPAPRRPSPAHRPEGAG